eukprot:2454082-Pleurochrysis_carterae.AAC.1
MCACAAAGGPPASSAVAPPSVPNAPRPTVHAAPAVPIACNANVNSANANYANVYNANAYNTNAYDANACKTSWAMPMASRPTPPAGEMRRKTTLRELLRGAATGARACHGRSTRGAASTSRLRPWRPSDAGLRHGQGPVAAGDLPDEGWRRRRIQQSVPHAPLKCPHCMHRRSCCTSCDSKRVCTGWSIDFGATYLGRCLHAAGSCYADASERNKLKALRVDLLRTHAACEPPPCRSSIFMYASQARRDIRLEASGSSPTSGTAAQYRYIFYSTTLAHLNTV